MSPRPTDRGDHSDNSIRIGGDFRVEGSSVALGRDAQVSAGRAGPSPEENLAAELARLRTLLEKAVADGSLAPDTAGAAERDAAVVGEVLEDPARDPAPAHDALTSLQRATAGVGAVSAAVVAVAAALRGVLGG